MHDLSNSYFLAHLALVLTQMYRSEIKLAKVSSLGKNQSNLHPYTRHIPHIHTEHTETPKYQISNTIQQELTKYAGRSLQMVKRVAPQTIFTPNAICPISSSHKATNQAHLGQNFSRSVKI